MVDRASAELRERMNEFLDQTRTRLDAHGWIVQGVYPAVGDRGVGFTYSIGVSERFEHPEICMSGFGYDLSVQLTNDVVQNIRGNNLDVRDPCLVDGIIQDFPVAFRPIVISSVREDACLLVGIYGDRPCVQMILPDAQGYFPWDVMECDEDMAEAQTCNWEATGPIPTRRFSVAGREPAPRA